jgi:hypothetical protein
MKSYAETRRHAGSAVQGTEPDERGPTRPDFAMNVPRDNLRHGWVRVRR